MRMNKFVGIILLAVFAVLLGGEGCAQQKAQNPPVEETVSIKGKIGYTKPLGGYFVDGQEPSEGYMIVNRNLKLLEKLYKSGKSITVQGYYAGSADRLFIEKIDGQPYKAE